MPRCPGAGVVGGGETRRSTRLREDAACEGLRQGVNLAHLADLAKVVMAVKMLNLLNLLKMVNIAGTERGSIVPELGQRDTVLSRALPRGRHGLDDALERVNVPPPQPPGPEGTPKRVPGPLRWERGIRL